MLELLLQKPTSTFSITSVASCPPSVFFKTHHFCPEVISSTTTCPSKWPFCRESLLPSTIKLSNPQSLHMVSNWPSSQSRACKKSGLHLSSPYSLSYLTWVSLPRRQKSKRKIAMRRHAITLWIIFTVLLEALKCLVKVPKI